MNTPVASQPMTADLVALADRLLAHAEVHAQSSSPHDDEQAQWERDLREAASALRSSGEAVAPSGWVSVSVALPETPGWYIAYNYRQVEPLRFDGVNWHHTRPTRDLAMPSHWQPFDFVTPPTSTKGG